MIWALAKTVYIFDKDDSLHLSRSLAHIVYFHSCSHILCLLKKNILTYQNILPMIVHISRKKNSFLNKQKHLFLPNLLPLISIKLTYELLVQFFGSSVIKENDYLKIKYWGIRQSNGVKIYQKYFGFVLNS